MNDKKMEIHDAFENILILANERIKQMESGEKKDEMVLSIKMIVDYYIAQLADYSYPVCHPQSERNRRQNAWIQTLISKDIPVPEWLSDFTDNGCNP